MLVDRLRFVRHNQVLVNTHHHADTLAFRAGTQGIIEIEQVLARFDELYPVRLKALREDLDPWYIVLCPLYMNLTFALSLKERGLYAVRKTVTGRLLVIDHDTIDQQVRLVSLCFLPRAVIQTNGISVDHQSTETLTHPQSQLILERATFGNDDRA